MEYIMLYVLEVLRIFWILVPIFVVLYSFVVFLVLQNEEYTSVRAFFKEFGEETLVFCKLFATMTVGLLLFVILMVLLSPELRKTEYAIQKSNGDTVEVNAKCFTLIDESKFCEIEEEVFRVKEYEKIKTKDGIKHPWY